MKHIQEREKSEIINTACQSLLNLYALLPLSTYEVFKYVVIRTKGVVLYS